MMGLQSIVVLELHIEQIVVVVIFNQATFHVKDRARGKSYSLLRPQRSGIGGRNCNGSCLLRSRRKSETCLSFRARCLGSSRVTVALLRGALKTLVKLG